MTTFSKRETIMKMKRIVNMILVTLSCWPMTVHASYAARIYNQSGGIIQVFGYVLDVPGATTNVVINNGQESQSLQWQTETSVTAFQVPTRATLCTLNFGFHAQIQGGNYMVVSGPVHPSCIVCDSNHNPLAGKGQC